MLLVKTRVAQSAISGLGLFADETIPQGTVIWKFTPPIDVRLTDEEYEAFKAQYPTQNLEKYIYRSRISKQHILCGDDARFINHSPDPNTIDTQEGEEGLTIAIREIH